MISKDGILQIVPGPPKVSQISSELLNTNASCHEKYRFGGNGIRGLNEVSQWDGLK